MLFNTIIALLVASVSALPSLTERDISTLASTPVTFALTGLAKGAAQVYLAPNSKATKAHIFAVGTTFAATDYATLGQSLASNDVISVILDFSPGSTFKSYTDYPLALDSTLKALATAAPTWGAKYNVSFSAVPSNIFLGGHSAGGWAAIGYAISNTTAYAGFANWDPVVGNPAIANYTLSYPHLIAMPVNSGCTGQISATNNGEYFYKNALGTAGTVVYGYTNTAIRHNSVTSSGFIGNLVCAGKVTGFQANLAATFASFMSSPSTFVAKSPGSTTGTFAYKIASK